MRPRTGSPTSHWWSTWPTPTSWVPLIRRLQPNFVVTASDVVAGDALTAAAETGAVEVFPTARCARLTADREGLRRLAADELGLPTAPFWFAGSLDELHAVADHAGYPLRVQPVAR